MSMRASSGFLSLAFTMLPLTEMEKRLLSSGSHDIAPAPLRKSKLIFWSKFSTCLMPLLSPKYSVVMLAELSWEVKSDL